MERIIVEIEEPIGWITFNRPEALNAFDITMWRTLPEVMRELDKNPEVKVMILRGARGVFGAGADIKELLEYREKGISQEYADAVHYCFEGMLSVEKPTIAAVERYALGGGCMVALACDIRVAGKGAKIGIPLVKLGLAVEPLGIKRLIDVAGVGFASEFLLTGTPIPQEKLLASGMVNYMVEDPEVVEFSRKLALDIIKNGEFALKTTKKIIREFTQAQSPNWEMLSKAFAQCMETEDFAQRATRFLKKG